MNLSFHLLIYVLSGYYQISIEYLSNRKSLSCFSPSHNFENNPQPGAGLRWEGRVGGMPLMLAKAGYYYPKNFALVGQNVGVKGAFSEKFGVFPEKMNL